ncbi:MAG: hypothetical protein AB7F28_04895 [Candidatus Margulisiibacteriota bacterium]
MKKTLSIFNLEIQIPGGFLAEGLSGASSLGVWLQMLHPECRKTVNNLPNFLSFALSQVGKHTWGDALVFEGFYGMYGYSKLLLHPEGDIQISISGSLVRCVVSDVLCLCEDSGSISYQQAVDALKSGKGKMNCVQFMAWCRLQNPDKIQQFFCEEATYVDCEQRLYTKLGWANRTSMNWEKPTATDRTYRGMPGYLCNSFNPQTTPIQIGDSVFIGDVGDGTPSHVGFYMGYDHEENPLILSLNRVPKPVVTLCRIEDHARTLGHFVPVYFSSYTQHPKAPQTDLCTKVFPAQSNTTKSDLVPYLLVDNTGFIKEK